MSLNILDDPGVDGGVCRDTPRASWWQVPWIRLGRMHRTVRPSQTWCCQAGSLADLDEHMLRDIGLTRVEVRCGRCVARTCR